MVKTILISWGLAGLLPLGAVSAETNPILKVGIIQRFGSKPTDR